MSVRLLVRRANAYQAYDENMSLRATSMPGGSSMQLYRRAPFGRLADFMVLDTRQYLTDQPNDDNRSPSTESATPPINTLLGKEQRNWLCSSLVQSGATWNILAQQVMMGMVGRTMPNTEELGYSMDPWPGYTYERMQLVQFFKDRRIQNPVVLTGDIHANWVNDLRVDDREVESEVVAPEFLGISISSSGNGSASPSGRDKLLADNPCVRFHNTERGYVRCTVTPKEWLNDYVTVDDVLKPGGNSTTRASFVVEAGTPGAQPV